MDTSKMKNIVILKNLPSNIVDEAIVFLKTNQKILKTEIVDNKNCNRNFENKNTKEYIINEAEMVISDYVSNLEKSKKNNQNKDLEIKYKKLQRITILFGILMFVSLVINVIIQNRIKHLSLAYSDTKIKLQRKRCFFIGENIDFRRKNQKSGRNI